MSLPATLDRNFQLTIFLLTLRQYLSGKVAGPFVYETVKLGAIEVEKQIVGVAHTVDIALLDDVLWDGILGLAYPSSLLLEKVIPTIVATANL